MKSLKWLSINKTINDIQIECYGYNIVGEYIEKSFIKKLLNCIGISFMYVIVVQLLIPFRKPVMYLKNCASLLF